MTAGDAAARFTFSIVARGPRCGSLGIAVASSTVAIGSRCPQVAAGQAAVVTQGYTNPRLAPLALDLLGCGLAPDEVVSALRAHDRWIDYRQVAIVTNSGEAIGHTGSQVMPWSGQIVAESFVYLGNGLNGAGALDAMAAAFGDGRERPFEELLLVALERARSIVCSDRGALSAAMLVTTPGRRTRTDLRIDLARLPVEAGGDAVADLRRLFERYRPLSAYYEAWPDNPELGDWRQWDDAGPPSA